MSLKTLIHPNPYQLSKTEKNAVIAELLWELTFKHRDHCAPYNRILEAIPRDFKPTRNAADVPFLPIRLFKWHDFCSVSDNEIIRVLSSSGTTSQKPSRIFLDLTTANLLIDGFVAIATSFLKETPLPILFIDQDSTINNEKELNVRSYTLRGWNKFSSEYFLLLNDSLEVKWEELEQFLSKYQNQRILIFGLTFMVWQYLYKSLSEKNKKLNLPHSLLMHTGGWKKLQDSAIDNESYKKSLRAQLGIKEIYNFYGMTELIGVIFVECEQGHFHAPDFADILIRDPATLQVLPFKEKGLIQTLSILPRSFPGHSLLTEDLGMILGEDDCPCGRKGKYFNVLGRMPWAEIRGCSDTY